MNTNIVYTKEYCRQLEIAYGNNMMSEGGSIELDYMFNNEEITNKKLLDFGSGLGGAAFYLAQKYSAHVTGVEISSTMVNLSNESTPADLKERVIFKLYNNQNSRLPFANDSFDIIYSKGVLVHLSIEEKAAIFIEFKRILKNIGKIIIHDWISPYNLQWGENINYLIESERLPLYAHDKDHYINLLKESGFEVNCIDDRSHFNKSLLYARFDFVRGEQNFHLMEAELIEPSLYFNLDVNAANRFVAGLDKRFVSSTRLRDLSK